MAKNRIQVVVPALIDTKEFHPTYVMQKVLLTHLAEMGSRDCEELTNPPKILTALGHDRSNWYKWKVMKGFNEWWQTAIEEELRGDTLSKVHVNLARLAMTHRDSSTIKLYLERFDDEYKPSLRQVHSLDRGYPPPMDIEEALAISRAHGRKVSESQADDVSNS